MDISRHMFSSMVCISLSGKSMYRLGDDWVPLQKGDYCFMDAYVPAGLATL